MKKVCFITTGATARFDALIVAALSPECLQAFSDNGFTHINFQCGASLPQIEVLIPEEKKGLVLSYFDFNKQGLNKEMRACQEDDGSRNPDDQRRRGLIICHAGAGTVLDAMRLGLRMLVVPNESLLDNHQKELAEELESQGYATMSDTKNLAEAIRVACSKEEKPFGGADTSFAGVVDEVLGYEEDCRARLD